MQAKILVSGVYKITGVGAVVTGKVTEGTLTTGMVMSAGGKNMRIKVIKRKHKEIGEANVGDKVGLSLENSDYDALRNYEKKEIIFTE